MNKGDQIWILGSNNKITTSTISKIGSKWGYFKLCEKWQQEKFCLKAMRVTGSYGPDGTVFLSEETLNEHIQKEKLEREIREYFNAFHKFRAEDYSLEALVQIKTLLELKESPFRNKKPPLEIQKTRGKNHVKGQELNLRLVLFRALFYH